MKVDYNPYEGRTVKGSPSAVISSGEVIIDGDRFVGKKRRRPLPATRPESGARRAVASQADDVWIQNLPRSGYRQIVLDLEDAADFSRLQTRYDLSLSLSTTPSSVTRPCFTMMWMDGWLLEAVAVERVAAIDVPCHRKSDGVVGG